MNLKKVLLSLVVIVAVFGLVGCGKKQPVQVKQPEQKQEKANKEVQKNEEIDTSNWQTYKNEEFGFEVKHPKDWDVELKDEKTEKKYNVEKDSDRTVKLVIKKDYGDPAVTRKTSSFVVQFTDWFDITKDYYPDNSPKDLPIKTINIANHTAIIPEAYYGYYERGWGEYIVTLNPAPTGWGDFNAMIISPEEEDASTMRAILKSVKILE